MTATDNKRHIYCHWTDTPAGPQVQVNVGGEVIWMTPDEARRLRDRITRTLGHIRRGEH